MLQNHYVLKGSDHKGVIADRKIDFPLGKRVTTFAKIHSLQNLSWKNQVIIIKSKKKVEMHV